MKWSIHQLRKLQHKGIMFDEMVDVNEIVEEQPDIIRVSPMRLKGRADMSSTKIIFHLLIQGTMVLPCSRTLADVDVPIDVETNEIFLLTDSEFVGENDNFHTVTKDTIDLKPIIKEVIISEIPMQIFAEDSEEVALSKGQDWQVIEEQEETEKVDPRLAELAKLFDKKN